jgi:hypothetical protein
VQFASSDRMDISLETDQVVVVSSRLKLQH